MGDSSNWDENSEQILLSETSEEYENEISINESWNIDSAQISIVPTGNLNRQERVLFKKLELKARRMFAKNLKELGTCTIREHEIKTVDEDPIYQFPYRKSEKERADVRDGVKEMLDAGIIKASK